MSPKSTSQNPDSNKREGISGDASEKALEESTRQLSLEELVKDYRGKVPGRLVDEVARGRKVALVYIDNRNVVFEDSATISGDVVGHDKSEKGSKSDFSYSFGTSFGRVLRQNIRKVKVVYLETPNCLQAQRVLSDKSVLIIQGQAHTGKWTTALYLLSKIHAESIYEINPNLDLEKLNTLEFTGSSGYIIDTYNLENAEKLNPFVLHKLGANVKKNQSHLILTIDSKAKLPADVLSEYSVVWSDVPDAPIVLDKHFKWYLNGKHQLGAVRKIVKDPRVTELLGTRLLPGEVDRLAELLSESIRENQSVEEALERFTAFAREKVKDWFRSITNLEDRAMMLTLAVLSGASYQSVLEADARFQALVSPGAETTQSSITHSAFDTISSEKLKTVYAHVHISQQNTEFGRTSSETVLLDNPAFQPAVLEYVWKEFVRLRKPLLKWLEELGFDPSFDVRARAAAAVGQISKFDFSLVREEVLLSWANSEDSRARIASALALGVPSWTGETAPQVLALLHHWSTLSNNWRLNWTAAIAYGGLVGLRFPETALSDLRTLSKNEDAQLFEALSQSVVNLFQAGQLASDFYLKVLDSLIVWTSDRRARTETIVGLLLFLEIAEKAMAESDREKKAFPKILLLGEDEIFLEKVTELFRRALNNKLVRKPTLEVLYKWFQNVEEENHFYPQVEQIILELMNKGTDHEKDRLEFILRNWAHSDKRKLESISRVLSVLESK